jgi:hypothetical protein
MARNQRGKAIIAAVRAIMMPARTNRRRFLKKLP